MAWVRACYDAADPFLEDGVYVNYLGDEGEARIRAAYGFNYKRLVEVKTRHDPTNLFRLNQNVTPVQGSRSASPRVQRLTPAAREGAVELISFVVFGLSSGKLLRTTATKGAKQAATYSRRAAPAFVHSAS
jgi:hypothetical protein